MLEWAGFQKIKITPANHLVNYRIKLLITLIFYN
jgi:hypothetical protein